MTPDAFRKLALALPEALDLAWQRKGPARLR